MKRLVEIKDQRYEEGSYRRVVLEEDAQIEALERLAEERGFRAEVHVLDTYEATMEWLRQLAI